MEVVLMINKAVIKYENRLSINKEGNIKEAIKMTVMNMSMNLGYFDIKININKDEKMKRELMVKRIIADQAIDEIMEEKRNLTQSYQLLNNFPSLR